MRGPRLAAASLSPRPVRAAARPGKELTGGTGLLRLMDWSCRPGPKFLVPPPATAPLLFAPRIRGDGGGVFFGFGAGAGVERSVEICPVVQRSTACAGYSTTVLVQHY